KARWETDRYDSETTLRLAGLDLAGAEGDSLFAQHFGVPLTLALGLMRDVHGVIALTIPVSGGRTGGAQVDVGAVITEALRHAIVNALASPLRLIGAVAGGDDKVDATPEPIACAPGRPEVAAEARTRVEQLATVLGSAPSCRSTASPPSASRSASPPSSGRRDGRRWPSRSPRGVDLGCRPRGDPGRARPGVLRHQQARGLRALLDDAERARRDRRHRRPEAGARARARRHGMARVQGLARGGALPHRAHDALGAPRGAPH